MTTVRLQRAIARGGIASRRRAEELIREGRVDSIGLAQVARLGYFDYTVVSDIFEIARPK